jgi:hypothetical protein
MVIVLAIAVISAPPAAAAPIPSAAEVLRRVRAAVGYGAVRRLPYGFAITEQAGPGQIVTSAFGPHGELRLGDRYGFDGARRWQLDERRGMATPVPIRLHEKNAWPLWARGYAWLAPGSRFRVAVVPEETDGSHVALALTEPDGVLAARLYVDRRTWLPQRLVIPYESGPYTVDYSDYRPVLGFRLPYATTVTYRDSQTVRTVSVAPLARGQARFSPPPLPDDHSFDARLPALVETRPGTPLGAGVPPHVYVRVAVDGQPAGWFLVDSGADGMMIDTAIADRLGMPVLGRTRSVGADGRPREGTYRRGKSFSVGRLTVRNPLFLALDLSQNNAPPGESRAGVIGYDAFARAVVEFADDGRHVAFCDPSGYRFAAPGSWQPLSFIDLTPAVRAQIEGGRRPLVQIDTGTGDALDFYKQYVERERLLEGRPTKEETSAGAGGAFTVRTGILKYVELGGRRFDNIEVSFRTNPGREGGDATAGMILMKPFLTVFDYPHDRLAFLPVERTRLTPAEARCR